MFELKKIKGNTYYFEGYTNVGVFKNGKGQVILIDSCDHKKTVKALDKILEENGFKPDIIINTHGHVDHIAGNNYFSDKYGCKILATEMDSFFIKYTKVEPDIFYNGVTVNKKLNPYYLADSSNPEPITEYNLPNGIEIFHLPGHAWDMIAVKTEDNVLFLADSIMSKDTWEEHRLPYFGDVNKSIETMEMLKSVKADYYVPSHAAVTDDISELLYYNICKMNERKQQVLEIIDGRSAEETFAIHMNMLDLEIKSSRYQMYYLMHRHFIQSLIDDGKIEGEYNGERYIYRVKE